MTVALPFGYHDAAKLLGGRVVGDVVQAAMGEVEVMLRRVPSAALDVDEVVVTAPAAGAGALSLRLAWQGLLDRLVVALFRTAGRPIGDATFDANFDVAVSDVALARAWLHPDVRRALLANGEGWVYDIADGAVSATGRVPKDGVLLQPAAGKIVTAMQTVGALARGGVALAERWQAAAGVLGGRALGPPAFTPGETRIRWQHRGRAASIEALSVAGGVTQLEVELPVSVRESYQIGAGMPLLVPDRDVFADGVADSWQAIQPTSLTCDGARVALMWDGYEPDVARWQRALAVADGVAPVTDGPFR